LDRRLGGSQSRSGHDGEEKTSQLPPHIETPIIQPIAIPTEQPGSLMWCFPKGKEKKEKKGKERKGKERKGKERKGKERKFLTKLL